MSNDPSNSRTANGALEKDKWAAKWTYADDENMFDVLLDAKEKAIAKPSPMLAKLVRDY